MVGDLGKGVMVVGKVIPREAGAVESASGPVMMGKVWLREPGAVEKEAGQKATRLECLLGCVWVLEQRGRRGAAGSGVGKIALGDRAVVGTGDEARGTQLRVIGVGVGVGWVFTWGGGVGACVRAGWRVGVVGGVGGSGSGGPM